MHFSLLVCLWAFIMLCCAALASTRDTVLAGVHYGIGDWQANGLGNHRAIVEVTEASHAVHAQIPWRRHDNEYKKRAVLVYDLTTGSQILNAFACNLNRESGDVIFQPQTAPGRYAIYYMPYTEPFTSGDWRGGYLSPTVTAEPDWMERLGISASLTSEPLIRFLSGSKVRDEVWLGSPFEIHMGGATRLAGDGYTMSYRILFPGHRGPCVRPTLLAQPDGRGYTAMVYDYGGRLVMDIQRRGPARPGNADACAVDLVKANWDAPWDLDMNSPLQAKVTVRVLPDRTMISSQVQGMDKNGQPFVTPLLEAVDTSSDRIRQGAAPRFDYLYPGDDGAGVWVSDVQIRDQNGAVFFDSAHIKPVTYLENNLQVPDDKLNAMPKAQLVRMEARRRSDVRPDMESFYPMEIAATDAEVAALLEKESAPVLLFPEDRLRPVAMVDHLPVTWALDGPRQVFHGACQPGEYYCWQIGVYAAREQVDRLSLEFSDVRDQAGRTVVRRRDITCFNLEGIDNRGVRFTQPFTLGKGKVRALWIGLMIPESVQGELQGAVRVKVNGYPAQTVRFELTVSGPVIPNHGDDEPWRHSRLRWLNSTLGLDDADVPPPFTPVKRRGATLEILNRQITYGQHGLPERIVSQGADLLTAPIRFDVKAASDRAITWRFGKLKVQTQNPSRVSQVVQANADDLSLTLRSEQWFDGVVNCEATLRSRKPVDLSDVALVIPLSKEQAKYFVGFSYRGDHRPANWRWSWDKRYQDNGAWCGNVVAGLGLTLLGEQDYWDLAGLHWDQHLQWINEGKGGASLSEEGDAVMLRAYTGERSVTPDKPLHLRFRLLITPFKPLRPDHWDLWFMGNIPHYHHATNENPYINYPFMTIDTLKKVFASNRSQGYSRTTLYCTVRDLSNIAPELFAFRSLGEEIIVRTGAFVYGTEGFHVAQEGGGHPWLREHLGMGYSPGWHQTLPSGEVDAAVASNGNGRLINYYIEGLAWLQKQLGNVGVYLDGIGYDRLCMLRLARTLASNGSDYYVSFHAGDDFVNPWSERRAPPVVFYMEHLPYVTQLMLGEVFWYDGPEGYWMTNLAGLPFGLDNQFYPVPGPDYPFRSMLYASAPNITGVAKPIRDMWKQWGVGRDTRVLGYWDKACPVKVNARDVYASVYLNQDRALICLASWSSTPQSVTLSVDWRAMGMDPARARASLPQIDGLQSGRATIDLNEPLIIEPGKGAVIGIELNSR